MDQPGICKTRTSIQMQERINVQSGLNPPVNDGIGTSLWKAIKEFSFHVHADTEDWPQSQIGDDEGGV